MTGPVAASLAAASVTSAPLTPLLAGVGAVLGLAIGSFLNVVIHRVPAGLSVVSPRSRCPGCETEITARDNIPVLSWVLLGRRCRACHEPISARYPLVELLTVVAFVALAFRFGDDGALPAYWVLAAGLIALSAIDLDTRRLPNKVLYPTLFLGGAILVVDAAVGGHWDRLARAGLGGLLAFAFFFIVHLVSPKGMGFGDVRLSGLLGLFLGWLSLGHVALGLFLGFLLGAVVGIGLMVAGRGGRKTAIPFGPFLAAGAYLAILAGRPLLALYLGH